MADCQLIDKSNVNNFLDSFDTVLTDCDGVLWNGQNTIPGSPEALEFLRSKGKKIFYVTNNSTKSRDVYVSKCAKLGFSAKKDEIIGTAFVLAQYLKHEVKLQGKVYLLGSKGIADELDAVGIPYIGMEDHKVTEVDENYISNMDLDPEVTCVVVGFDFKFNYFKLASAACYLRQPNVRFFLTNTDAVLPLGGGKACPGTGALTNSVEIAGGRKAEAIMGKPHQPMFEMIQKLHNVDPARTIMIGDRLETDIMFGHACSLHASVLVLSGVASLEDVQQRQSSNSVVAQQQIPHYYIPTLGDLQKLVE